MPHMIGKMLRAGRKMLRTKFAMQEPRSGKPCLNNIG